MTITLPEPLAALVEERAARLGYESAEAYVVFLVQREADDELSNGPPHLIPANQEELDRMLVAGIESGPPVLVDEAFWDAQRRVLRERMDERRKTGS